MSARASQNFRPQAPRTSKFLVDLSAENAIFSKRMAHSGSVSSVVEMIETICHRRARIQPEAIVGLEDSVIQAFTGVRSSP
jgi:hypothetical protein